MRPEGLEPFSLPYRHSPLTSSLRHNLKHLWSFYFSFLRFPSSCHFALLVTASLALRLAWSPCSKKFSFWPEGHLSDFRLPFTDTSPQTLKSSIFTKICLICYLTCPFFSGSQPVWGSFVPLFSLIRLLSSSISFISFLSLPYITFFPLLHLNQVMSFCRFPKCVCTATVSIPLMYEPAGGILFCPKANFCLMRKYLYNIIKNISTQRFYALTVNLLVGYGFLFLFSLFFFLSQTVFVLVLFVSPNMCLLGTLLKRLELSAL